MQLLIIINLFNLKQHLSVYHIIEMGLIVGTVGDYVDEGKPRTFLETEYCKYVDFEDLANNVEVLKEVVEILKNPPDCSMLFNICFLNTFHNSA